MGAVRPLGNRFCRGGERAPPFLAPRIGWGRRQAGWRKAPEGCGRRWRRGGSSCPEAEGRGSAEREGKRGAH